MRVVMKNKNKKLSYVGMVVFSMVLLACFWIAKKTEVLSGSRARVENVECNRNNLIPKHAND